LALEPWAFGISTHPGMSACHRPRRCIDLRSFPLAGAPQPSDQTIGAKQ
jgi:hypothetical protein